jgi:hypothetical protein
VRRRASADGGEADRGRGQHDHEAEDADEGDPADGAGHQDADTGQETDRGEDRAALGGAAEVGATEGRGELRILLDEGALHLLQRSKLFLGERHGNLPSHGDGLMASVSSPLGIR